MRFASDGKRTLLVMGGGQTWNLKLTRLGSLYPLDFRIKLSRKKTITKEEYSNGNKCEKHGTEC